MSLIELKKHLQKVRMATLSGLCAIFKIQPSSMELMLDFWIEKGSVRRCKNPTSCSTPCSNCMQCGVPKDEYYEWVVN